MSERQALYAAYEVHEVNPLVVPQPQPTLTCQEIKLIMRVRDAAKTGQMILVDADAMVWYGVGKMERPR